MKTLTALVRRNTLLFFKDKGTFFTSLITPMILLVLYASFLGNVYKDSFLLSFEPYGLAVSDKLINGLVAGQLLSSLLAACCVTVSFCSNMLMVQDKATKTLQDLTITPVKRSTLALSYYISSVLTTLLVFLIALIACLIYIATQGWFLSAADVALIFLDMVLLILFGTALSSIINFFLTTQGQISAVGTIVSSVYGFICGAYMPISQFGTGLQKLMSFLPGTYGTALTRNHCLGGAFRELERQGYPQALIQSLADVMDCNPKLLGESVGISGMYVILCGTILLLMGIYILMHSTLGKKINRM